MEGRDSTFLRWYSLWRCVTNTLEEDATTLFSVHLFEILVAVYEITWWHKKVKFYTRISSHAEGSKTHMVDVKKTGKIFGGALEKTNPKKKKSTYEK